VAICSPSVPPLFSDNFDFQTRDDFVRGLLMNEEILASTIYWYKLDEAQYAACVSNWQMYQSVRYYTISCVLCNKDMS
jgi:translation initiation factor eIF-2B subunit epsilon